MKLALVHTLPARLSDGPLVDIRRSEIVPRIAKALIRYGAASCEADTFRALVGNGFSAFELAVYLPDAMQFAQQEIVAAEISKP